MKRKQQCPVCEKERVTELYTTVVPVLQNRVYATKDEAVQSKQATMILTHCANCNFVFNSAFDEKAIVYDENYDNSVPSKMFQKYYEEIADYLYQKYRLQNSCVYDIGCGKGTFLKLMCSRFPDVRGIGIDPSYEGDLRPTDNLVFIQDFFQTSHVSEAPALVLSRHVFEHIEFPVAFLKIISEPLKDHPDVPVFIEVPDFNWIVRNQTFWDICYEHCNYFSPNPVGNMFSRSGVELNSITPAFGDQYLWIEGRLNPTDAIDKDVKELPGQSLDQIQTFVANINHNRETAARQLSSYKTKGYKIVVWGMATKGVIFSLMVDPERKLIDYCIDINKAKQQQYIPGSGHQIHAPGKLTSLKEKLLVVIMNLNYADEIKNQVTRQPETIFMDAHGNVI